jgi:predicted ATPase/DNA-binding CsgD family transcriptional regulator
MLIQEIQLHNLPPQPTPFIGREPEIAEIVELLQDENCRLLTMLGPGGIGKTRLSIESISRLTKSDFEHGVFYVPLAPLTSAENIVTTVINVLGIMIGDDGTPQEELVKFLSGRNLLLVMDNFEHVLEGADLVADILTNALDVKVLVTSREPLNLQEEWVWHVKGMRFPENATTDDIDRYSALRLFLDRAKRVRREFSVDTELDCAIRICQLVGGMPLAIELSASWLKTLSCQEIIKEIKSGIDFLSTRTRNIPERHRSIRAVFDHSWSLLSSDEQAVFPHLSVFRGGFTRDAAQKVAGADLMILSGLVEKSMVRRDSIGRYDVHELLRQYAEEKLEAVGETETIVLAYLSYFADFMREHAIDIKGRQQLDGLNEIEDDWDNIVEAWYQAIDDIDYSALDHMMEGLALFCEMRARYKIGEELFNLALNARAPLHDSADLAVYNRLRTRYIQVWFLPERIPIPEYIRQILEDALHDANQRNDDMTIMLCQWLRCEFNRIQSVGNNDEKDKANIAAYDTPLQLARQLEAHYYEGRVMRGIDHIWSPKSYHESRQAQEFSRQARKLTQQIGDIDGYTHLLFYQAFRTLRPDSHERLEYLLEAISRWEMIKDIKSIGVAKHSLGWWYFEAGDFQTAERYFVEAERTLTNVNYLNMHGSIYAGLSRLHTIQGQYDEGYQLAKKTHVYSVSSYHIDMTYYFIGLSDFENARHHLMSALKGRQDIEYFEYILLAFMLNHVLKHVRAVELLSLAYNHPRSVTNWMEKWELLSQLKIDLREALGEDIYNTVSERGSQLDIELTINELLVLFETTKTPNLLPQPLAEPLTERELEVLELIAEGLTNPEIADKLYLSTGTVKVHTRNIYGKLNVSNRTESSTIARKLNLI